MMSVKNTVAVAVIGASLLAAGGCSVNKAFSKPAPKDLGFLAVGGERDSVRSELGEHVISSDSAACDVHSFVSGSGGGKYVRGVFYSLLDLASLGIMEIITNPIESSIGNEKIRLRACYDQSNKLVKAEKLFKTGNKQIVPKLPKEGTPAAEATPVAEPAAAPAVEAAPAS